ncbi:hypothetical protein BC828DRAFT_140987 [Blastocladiella britannica]|nr:hypothetical protein BC828DRAFT_140987 [Blastocladiella britannica]
MADHEDSTEDAMARSNAELDAFVRQLAGTRVPPAPNNSQHFAHVQTVAAIASPPAPSSPNMSIPNLPPQPRNSRQTMIRGVVPSTASASALADSQSSIGSRASQRIAPRTSTTDGAYGRGTASVPIVDIPGSAAEYAFNGGSLGNWSTEASTPSSTLERSLHHTGARSPSAHAQLLERSFSSISSSSLREEEGPEPTSTTTTTTATNATFTKPSGIRSPPAVLTPPPPGMPDIVVTQAASLGSTNKIQALAVPKGSDQNISTTPRNSQLISLTPGTTNGSSLASIATSIVTQDRAISPPNLEPEELDIDEDIVEVSKLRELRQLLNRKVHKLVKFVQESRTRIAMDPSFIFWQIFDGFVRIADIVNFLTIPVVISYACDILSEHVLFVFAKSYLF